MSGKSGSSERESEREIPNPEVVAGPKRRRFTAEYKARILAEADRCTRSGEIGAMLRREGLYSSHLITWRRQREEEGAAGLSRKRGRKADPDRKLVKKIDQLEGAKRRLEEKLRKAQIVIDFQKKMAEVWAATDRSESEEND